MSSNNLAGRVAAEAPRGMPVGLRWRIVLKLVERRSGVEKWLFQVYPPGKGAGKLVSSFEVSSKEKKGGFALAVIGCVERLLGKLLPPGGERTGTVRDIDWALD
jgi:hypothetical protein